MFTEKNGSKLYFVYLPEKDRYLINYSNTNREKILNILNDLNIYVIDITQSFANHKNIKSLFPLRHRHYNEKGYEKVSEVIKNYFEQN